MSRPRFGFGQHDPLGERIQIATVVQIKPLEKMELGYRSFMLGQGVPVIAAKELSHQSVYLLRALFRAIPSPFHERALPAASAAASPCWDRELTWTMSLKLEALDRADAPGVCELRACDAVPKSASNPVIANTIGFDRAT